MDRIKARRREQPRLPPEYIYAERQPGGRWVAAGTVLSEAQFVEGWEALSPFEPYVPPPSSTSRARERVRSLADGALLGVINLANRARRVTAPAPETYVPRAGVSVETVVEEIPAKAPALVAGEVVTE